MLTSSPLEPFALSYMLIVTVLGKLGKPYTVERTNQSKDINTLTR